MIDEEYKYTSNNLKKKLIMVKKNCNKNIKFVEKKKNNFCP